jgi:hypothetical protein
MHSSEGFFEVLGSGDAPLENILLSDKTPSFPSSASAASSSLIFDLFGIFLSICLSFLEGTENFVS